MKKITLLTLLAVGISSAYAQTRLGITAGFGHASTHWSYSEPSTPPAYPMKKSFSPAWQAGLLADIQLTGRLYLQPQLLVSVKGNSGYIDAKYDPTIRRLEAKSHSTYLELPVNVVYKHPLGKGKLIAGGGGYIARGLSGGSSTTYYFRDGHKDVYKYGLKFKSKLSSAEMEQYTYVYQKTIDLGLNFVTGYELKNGLSFKLNYSMGLKSKTPTYQDREITTKSKNRYFAASISYLMSRRS